MRILIAQPKHEDGVEQLTEAIISNRDVEFFLFPEGYLQSEFALKEAQELAKNYTVIVVTSYRKDNKDVAVIIDESGVLVYSRPKTPSNFNEVLVQPLEVKVKQYNLAYLLCMEILKGARDLQFKNKVDLIVHPIGVGMFSEEQFDEWIEEARKIALKTNSTIIGTSHADGSYKNCGISIPIAYCIDAKGEFVFLSKNDTAPQIINLTL